MDQSEVAFSLLSSLLLSSPAWDHRVALTPPSAAAQPEVKRLKHVLHERAANEGEVASSTIDQSSLYEVGMPPCLLIPFHLFTSLDRSSRDL